MRALPRTAVFLIGAVLLCGLQSHGLAQAPFASITTAEFDIKYQRDVKEHDVRMLLDFLQNDRKTLTAQLGVSADKKIEVRVYETVGAFLSETGLKQPWRGAYFTRGVIHTQPITALVQRDILETSVTFELALAVLEPSAQKGCPRWLREAYAVYHSGEMSAVTPAVGVKLSSFADLDQDIQQYPNPPQRGDVHYILGLTMQFLIERYGEAKAFSVFKAFDGVKLVETVFKQTFEEEYKKLETAWASHIQQKTAPAPHR